MFLIQQSVLLNLISSWQNASHFKIQHSEVARTLARFHHLNHSTLLPHYVNATIMECALKLWRCACKERQYWTDRVYTNCLQKQQDKQGLQININNFGMTNKQTELFHYLMFTFGCNLHSTVSFFYIDKYES